MHCVVENGFVHFEGKNSQTMYCFWTVQIFGSGSDITPTLYSCGEMMLSAEA